MEGGSGEGCGEENVATGGTSILSLPVKVLLHIFSFLSTKDLCATVPKVCSMWAELHQDPSIYRVLCFDEFTCPMHIDKCTALATSLQSITVRGYDVDNILRILCRNNMYNAIGGQLRTFRLVLVGSSREIRRSDIIFLESTVHTLLKKSLNLQTFCLQGFRNYFTSNFFNQLSAQRFHHLTSNLRVVHFVDIVSVNNNSERYFVTKCPFLEEIKVYNNNCKSYNHYIFNEKLFLHTVFFTGEELRHLCGNSRRTLRVLHLNYGDWLQEDVKSLAMCYCLEDLCFYNAYMLRDGVLQVIGSLTGLRKLEISCAILPGVESWISMLSSPALKSLESLVLEECSISKITVCAIGDNLINLKTLFLKRARMYRCLRDDSDSDVFPSGFKKILCGCPKLEELTMIDVGKANPSELILISHFLPRLRKINAILPLGYCQELKEKK